MLTQRAVSWRLVQQRCPHITDLLDLSNAFMCTKRSTMNESIEVLFVENDVDIMLDRTANFLIYLSTEGKDICFVAKNGGLMGTTEAPPIFATSFDKPLSKWLAKPTVSAPELVLTSPIAETPVPGDVTTFADDICKKYVIDIDSYCGNSKEYELK